MLSTLYQVVRRIGEGSNDTTLHRDACARSVDEAVQHVIDASSSWIRAVRGHTRQLRGPVANAWAYIDRLASGLPEPLSWGRGAFSEDPRLGALFARSHDLPRLFSRDAQVRHLFASNPGTDHCVAALSMQRRERRQPGISLVDDRLRRDTMLDVVSFRDHQLIPAGLDTTDAKAAFKCWLFESLINTATANALAAHNRRMNLQSRIGALRARLRRLRSGAATLESASELEREIAEMERDMATEALSWATPKDQLAFVIDVLSRPEQLLRCHHHSIFLDRLGVRHRDGAGHPAFEMPLYEIQVGEREPRIVSLVSFPRTALLPEHDFVQGASLSLACGGTQ